MASTEHQTRALSHAETRRPAPSAEEVTLNTCRCLSEGDSCSNFRSMGTGAVDWRSSSTRWAARQTLKTTGATLLGSALAMALGFGVLIFPSLTPFQQFGIVTAITIAYALVAAIVLVPLAMMPHTGE